MPSDLDPSNILRNDILAQLRSTARPVSTRTLRMRAAPVPVAGTTLRRPPLDQQVYRTLARLRATGIVASIPTCGRSVLWQLTAKGAAADEIAHLEALLTVQVPDANQPARPAGRTAGTGDNP